VKTLVTGATGFVGGHLMVRLLARFPASDITCLVKPSSVAKEMAALAQFTNAGVRIIEGDLDRPAVSPERPPQVELIFHLAANIDTSAPDAALTVNDVGTRHLLSWLGEQARGARLIYASSIAVLDRDHAADGPLNESSPCVPRTEYGHSKLRGEQIIQAEAERQGYSYTILRLATVYGPGAKADGLFDLLFKLTAKHSVVARLDWPGRTSIVHVDDVTEMMVGLAQLKQAENEIYCIANPEAPTVGALADQIARLAPEPVRPIRLPKWVWKAARAIAWTRPAQMVGAAVAQTTFWRLTLMVDDGFWFDTQKLQTVWSQPTISLAEGLAEMLKYL
jgi:nucleoside-diphosphate-sugar epimerase